jgi:hypothetical protein
MGVVSEFNRFFSDSFFLYDGIGQSCKQLRHENDGTRIYEVMRGFPSLCTGSVITFRLDLTGSGTLSAQVNKDSINEFVLFENLLMEGEEVVDKTFVPIANLQAPAAINFLGFETA